MEFTENTLNMDKVFMSKVFQENQQQIWMWIVNSPQTKISDWNFSKLNKRQYPISNYTNQNPIPMFAELTKYMAKLITKIW